MTKACRCLQGEGGIKPSEYVRISTIYFPFLKIFSIRKKNEKVMEVSLTLHLNS